MTNPQTGIHFSTDEESVWGAANDIPAPTQPMGAPKARKSCDMLGVCQQHTPACKGCTATPLRLLAVSVAVVAVVVLVSGAAGYMWAVSK